MKTTGMSLHTLPLKFKIKVKRFNSLIINSDSSGLRYKYPFKPNNKPFLQVVRLITNKLTLGPNSTKFNEWV